MNEYHVLAFHKTFEAWVTDVVVNVRWAGRLFLVKAALVSAASAEILKDIVCHWDDSA